MKRSHATEYHFRMCKISIDSWAPKKVVLLLEPGEIFLSPTRPDQSNVYENIYFLFRKNTHTNKKFSTSKFICANLRFFFPQKVKDRALCFSTKKNAVRVVF